MIRKAMHAMHNIIYRAVIFVLQRLSIEHDLKLISVKSLVTCLIH